MRTRTWASIVVSLLLVPLLAAQAQYGAITGVVIDTAGAVLPGATVTVTGSDRGDQRSTVTNDRGQFTIVGLPSGQYTLDVSLPGFNVVQRALTVVGGRTERLTIEMRVGALQETVTVTSETPAVDLQRSSRTVVLPGTVAAAPATPAVPRPSAPHQSAGVVGGALASERRYVRPLDTESYDHIDENRTCGDFSTTERCLRPVRCASRS